MFNASCILPGIGVEVAPVKWARVAHLFSIAVEMQRQSAATRPKISVASKRFEPFVIFILHLRKVDVFVQCIRTPDSRVEVREDNFICAGIVRKECATALQ